MEMNVNTEVLKKQTQPSQAKAKKQQFTPFSWVGAASHGENTTLLELARDVAAGVGMAVELVERAHLDEDEAYLSQFDCGVLQRFSAASCALLCRTIDEHFEYLNRRSKKGGAQ